MSTSSHGRDRHPADPAGDYDSRPRFMARVVWNRLTPEQRAETASRAGTGRTATTWRSAEAEEPPEDPGLTENDLAILRPLGKLAAVHNMAERLGLPTPDRPRPTTTTEEAHR